MKQGSRSAIFFRSQPTYFLLPVVVGFLCAAVVPLATLSLLGFLSWNLVGPIKWVGLQNFIEVSSDPGFHSSIVTTLSIGILGTICVVGAGALAGRYLSSWNATSRFVTAIFLLPWMAAPVAIAVMWKWILAPTGGVLSNFFGFRVDLLTNPIWAPVVIAAVFGWTGAGFTALLFASGLRSLPHNVREAARIDGATSWQLFWQIELPLLRRIVLFVVVTVSLQAFSLYDIVYVLTGGGPGTATDVVSLHIVHATLTTFELGQSAVMSLAFIGIEALVIAGEAGLYFLLTRKFHD